jgi:hypothetical protein
MRIAFALAACAGLCFLISYSTRSTKPAFFTVAETSHSYEVPASASTVVSCSTDTPTSYQFSNHDITLDIVYNPCEDVFYVSGACGVLHQATEHEKASAFDIWIRVERDRMRQETKRFNEERVQGLPQQQPYVKL